MKVLHAALLLTISLWLGACDSGRHKKEKETSPIAPTAVVEDEAQKKYREREEPDILEATFRYQFEHNASGGVEKMAAAFYLSRGGGKDLPDEFMNRFAGHTPPVKKRSEAQIASDRIEDKTTGRPGLGFHCREIKWISDTEVDVTGGYYAAGDSSSSNLYHLKKIDGKWQVTDDKLMMIS
jgi:hypothetical protein